LSAQGFEGCGGFRDQVGLTRETRVEGYISGKNAQTHSGNASFGEGEDYLVAALLTGLERLDSVDLACVASNQKRQRQQADDEEIHLGPGVGKVDSFQP